MCAFADTPLANSRHNRRSISQGSEARAENDQPIRRWTLTRRTPIPTFTTNNPQRMSAVSIRLMSSVCQFTQTSVPLSFKTVCQISLRTFYRSLTSHTSVLPRLDKSIKEARYMRFCLCQTSQIIKPTSVSQSRAFIPHSIISTRLSRTMVSKSKSSQKPENLKTEEYKTDAKWLKLEKINWKDQDGKQVG